MISCLCFWWYKIFLHSRIGWWVTCEIVKNYRSGAGLGPMGELLQSSPWFRLREINGMERILCWERRLPTFGEDGSFIWGFLGAFLGFCESWPLILLGLRIIFIHINSPQFPWLICSAGQTLGILSILVIRVASCLQIEGGELSQ